MNLTASLGVGKLSHRDGFVPIEPGSHVAALGSPSDVPRKKYGRAAAKHDAALLPVMVVYARFIAWAIEQSHFPQAKQVMDRFHCSKATAHRWLNFLAEAYGVDRPRRCSAGQEPQR